MTSPPASSLRVVVLGGGPAGLAAAHLAQQQGHAVTLVERYPWVGGKGASRAHDGFILDFGPHAYHPKTRAINELITEHAGADYLLGPVRMELIIAGRTLQFPFRPLEGLQKFPLTLSARILADFVAARLRRVVRGDPEDSFRSWGQSQFGQTMYRLCFGDYTERVWGVPADALSVELAKRKLPRMSIRGIVGDLFLRRGTMHAHLFGNAFGYHRNGIGRVFEGIADGIARRGGRILRGHEVAALPLDADGRISSVVARGPDGPVDCPCDVVVSTIPLPRVAALVSAAGAAFDERADHLAFRDIALVYAVLRRPIFSQAHWTYLVDNRFAFHRISEQKNLSAACCPADVTMLTFEISAAACPQHEDELRRQVEADLSFFGVQGPEIGTIETFTLSDAYPIYRTGYEGTLARTLDRLSGVGNLVSTGRQGLFLDIDMHDAMVLARAAVVAVVRNQVPQFYREHEEILHRARAEDQK